jgi:hypothetical protein
MNSQAKSDSSLDYSDLVAELRSGEEGLEYAAADALEALMARIAELEAALRPFTDVESIVPFFHDAGWGLYAHVVTKRDMEAARAAYLGKKDD